MKPLDFVKKFANYALVAESATGIPASVNLAQSALETGWGDHAPGSMMFGVKDVDGLNGNEQLVRTFEYSKNGSLSAKQIGLNTIESVKPVLIGGVTFFKYTGKAYFRKYNTPSESFIDHARIFLTVKKYAPAMAELKKGNVDGFIKLMAPIYAQSPTYADTIIKMTKQVERLMKQI